jgi:hypothetical protein
MAKTATVNISVTVQGDGINLSYNAGGPETDTAAPGGGPQAFQLTQGFNTIAIPAGAIGVLIVPPSASTNVKIIKGLNGDTGQTVAPNQPVLFSFNGSPASFGLTSNNVTPETVMLLFF